VVATNENYSHYEAPHWVRPTVERLLSTLEPENLLGLGAIVLTNSSAIRGGKTQRVGGRKYDRRKCRGFYHAQWRGEPAWIELIIDLTMPSLPRPFTWFKFLQDVFIGRALYHELGHHLHAAIGSSARGGEASADDWKRRLIRRHVRTRYPNLRRMVHLLIAIARLIRRLFVREQQRRNPAAD
jgi:hypothetical protein